MGGHPLERLEVLGAEVFAGLSQKPGGFLLGGRGRWLEHLFAQGREGVGVAASGGLLEDRLGFRGAGAWGVGGQRLAILGPEVFAGPGQRIHGLTHLRGRGFAIEVRDQRVERLGVAHFGGKFQTVERLAAGGFVAGAQVTQRLVIHGAGLAGGVLCHLTGGAHRLPGGIHHPTNPLSQRGVGCGVGASGVGALEQLLGEAGVVGAAKLRKLLSLHPLGLLLLAGFLGAAGLLGLLTLGFLGTFGFGGAASRFGGAASRFGSAAGFGGAAGRFVADTLGAHRVSPDACDTEGRVLPSSIWQIAIEGYSLDSSTLLGPLQLSKKAAHCRRGEASSNGALLHPQQRRNFVGVLQNKIAVVTGGTRGLGRAIVDAYVQAGASVMLAARSEDDVDRVIDELEAQGHKVAGLPCDVSDPEQVEELVDYTREVFGRFDIWVNNAAIVGGYGPTMDIPHELFLQVIHTNILGVYYGSRVAMQHFLKPGGGRLINVTSVEGRKPSAMVNGYAASKAWVRHFTLALAQEYEKSGIGIHLLDPGILSTDMLRQVAVLKGYLPSFQAVTQMLRPWLRSPEQAAEKAVWLASQATHGMTGLESKAMGFVDMLKGATNALLQRFASSEEEQLFAPPAEIPSGRGKRLHQASGYGPWNSKLPAPDLAMIQQYTKNQGR